MKVAYLLRSLDGSDVTVDSEYISNVRLFHRLRFGAHRRTESVHSSLHCVLLL